MKKACFALMLLALACLLPAQNFPLTLTAPNGGEIWNTGSTYLITWSQVNLAGPASLMLLSGNDPASTTIMIAPSVPVAAGQFNWTIPPNIPTGANYKVRINLAAANGIMIWDASDGPFTIQGGTIPPPPQMSITVVAPNGGEQWAAGSTQTIAWNYTNLTGEVSIGLIGANTNAQIIIAPSVPIDAQNFQWTVPANFAPGLYKVHIVWLTILAVYIGDLSDGFFAITNGTPPPPPILEVTSPNGGETWEAGTMHPITWNFNGTGGSVLIQLMGGPQMTPINIIAPNVPANAGQFDWLIPPYQMPGDAYQVQVQLLDPAGVFVGDISDAPFTITAGNPNTPWITVVAPNGGEQWAAGSTQTIAWNFGNLEGEVYIALIGANANTQSIIAPAVPIAGHSWQWTIPTTIMPGAYKIHVVWLSVLDIYIGDQSDGWFQIVNDTPPPQPIVLTSPNGGEVWTVGNTYPITWLSADLAGFVSLTLLGANNPASATIPIAMGVPVADQSFAWTIPDFVPPGTNYRVRIALSSSNGVLVQDFSDGMFAIQAGENPPPQTLVVTSPNGGEIWTKGTWHDITWTDTSNASAVRILLIWESANGNRRAVIARNAPNTGVFSWFIPLRLPVGNHYRIAVRSVTGAMDLSDGQFSIVSPVTNLSARPNPTSKGTTLSFEVSAPVTASVRLYNVRGQCVRVLAENRSLSGQQTILWDGNDASGRKVSPGIYFARIISPELNASQKIIVLK